MAEWLASSRRSVSQGAVQKTAREKIKKARYSYLLEPLKDIFTWQVTKLQ